MLVYLLDGVLSVLLLYGALVHDLLAVLLLLSVCFDLLLDFLEADSFRQTMISLLIYLPALLLQSNHVVKDLILVDGSLLDLFSDLT